MIGRRERFGFVIRNRYVGLMFDGKELTIQQTDITLPQDDISQLKLTAVPPHLSHLFNSVRHVFHYLTTNPESMVQMTEDKLSFVIEVNGFHQICSLSFERMQLSRQELALKKKRYQLIIKSYELREAIQKKQTLISKLSKRWKEAKEIQVRECQKLNESKQVEQSILGKIQAKQQEKSQLQVSLRRKEQILMELKLKEGAFVSID